MVGSVQLRGVTLQQFPCCLCADRGVRRLGITVPVIVVPIKTKYAASGYYPVDYCLRFRGALCHEHSASFNMAKFTDHYGLWYDAVGDKLRSTRRPAVNPYPNDKSFKWESFIVDPDWHPAPLTECRLVFWSAQTLAAKGASYSTGPMKG